MTISNLHYRKPGGPFYSYTTLGTAYNSGVGRVALVADSRHAAIASRGDALKGRQIAPTVGMVTYLTGRGVNIADSSFWNGHFTGTIFTQDSRVTADTPGNWTATGRTIFTSGADNLILTPGFTYDRVRYGYLTTPGTEVFILEKNAVTVATVVQGAAVGYSVNQVNATLGTQPIKIRKTVGTTVTVLPFVDLWQSAAKNLIIHNMAMAGFTVSTARAKPPCSSPREHLKFWRPTSLRMVSWPRRR